MKNPLLSERFHEAMVFAASLHASQTRKGGNIPYVAHLLAVTSIVLEHGGNEDEAIGALLHDAVEDQGGLQTLEEIRRRFGDAVADIVDGCSDCYQDDAEKPPWRERKEAYIRHLSEASASVLLVSAADKFHNLRSLVMDYRLLGEELWPRFRGGRDGTLWYYRELLRVYQQVGRFSHLVGELERLLNDLQRLMEPGDH